MGREINKSTDTEIKVKYSIGSYEKYLHTKLYMIEHKARHAVMNGDNTFQEILDIIMASPTEIQRRLNNREF